MYMGACGRETYVCWITGFCTCMHVTEGCMHVAWTISCCTCMYVAKGHIHVGPPGAVHACMHLHAYKTIRCSGQHAYMCACENIQFNAIVHIHVSRVSPKGGYQGVPPPPLFSVLRQQCFVRIKIYNIIVLSVKAILIIIHQSIHSDSLPPSLFFFWGKH